MSANAKQVGGAHYKTDGVQHWDVAAALYGEAHFKCTATKYISRWRLKNGVQDLEKAKHYLEKLTELITQGIVRCTVTENMPTLVACLVEMAPDYDDHGIMIGIFIAETPAQFARCIQAIDQLIAGQTTAPAA